MRKRGYLAHSENKYIKKACKLKLAGFLLIFMADIM